MYIFCKSYPPLFGGDGILVERYLRYSQNRCLVYTVGLRNAENVFCLSKKFDLKYIVKAAREILKSKKEVIWAHSTALAVLFYPFIKIKSHKLILTTHGLWGLTATPTNYYPTWLRNKIIEYLFFKIAKIDLITTVDSYSQKVLKKYQTNVVYIPNGVDFDANVFRAIDPKEKEDAALFLGRHIKQKNLEFIIKIGKNKLLKIYLAGQGPLSNRFKKECASIAEISFLGQISDGDKYRYLKKVKFLLQPSLWEGFPLTILEALAHKTIPIIKNYADLKETDLRDFLIIIDESNYMAKINEAKNLTYEWDKLQELLTKNYAWERIIAQYDELFSIIKA